jgi:hypothetical protein
MIDKDDAVSVGLTALDGILPVTNTAPGRWCRPCSGPWT